MEDKKISAAEHGQITRLFDSLMRGYPRNNIQISV